MKRWSLGKRSRCNATGVGRVRRSCADGDQARSPREYESEPNREEITWSEIPILAGYLSRVLKPVATYTKPDNT